MSNISAKSQQGNNWSIFLGLVLEDKDPGSKDIKVHLEELIPFVEGEVNPKKMELDVYKRQDNDRPYMSIMDILDILNGVKK